MTSAKHRETEQVGALMKKKRGRKNVLDAEEEHQGLCV